MLVANHGIKDQIALIAYKVLQINNKVYLLSPDSMQIIQIGIFIILNAFSIPL